jgi:type II secretion system protein G
MAEIPHSKRTLYQATYSPVDVRNPKLLRVWDKWTYFATLADAVTDWRRLRGRLAARVEAIQDPRERLKLERALTDLDQLLPRLRSDGVPDALELAPLLREISVESLVAIGEAQEELERAHATQLLAAYAEIEKAYLTSLRDTAAPAVAALEAAGFQPVTESASPLSEFRIFRREEIAAAPPEKTQKRKPTRRPARTSAPRPPVPGRIAGSGRTIHFVAVRAPRTAKALPRREPRRMPTVAELASWALAHDVRTTEARALLALDASRVVSEPLALLLAAKADALKALGDGLRRRFELEPVGLLHLERLNFTPAGIERGELVHSVPLAPTEEVNITHREWSSTSNEFENIVTDYLEDFSERGVSEKSELADSTANQSQHSTGLNTGVNVSGGFGPVSISSSFSYNVQDSSARSEEHSRTRTRDVTNKASSRAKKEHKVTFRVASAAGTEDQRVQTLRNPDTTRAIRVDYYQLIRKWRVDLERYGLRLTYDLTIPAPGATLLARYSEIRALEAKVKAEFSFDVSPSQITPENYEELAALYLASVEAPPPPEMSYIQHEELTWQSFEEGEKGGFHALEYTIDERYVVTSMLIRQDYGVWTDGEDTLGTPVLGLETSIFSLMGSSGSVAVGYATDDLLSSFYWVRLTASLRPEVLDAWRLKAWNSMREAALVSFEANRTRYQERINQLRAELEATDALRLRKLEREEVMKTVLAWMLGPGFTFDPSSVQLPSTANLPALAQAWARTLAFGEFIKFIHNAIEWENMLYFLYPYFWAPQRTWPLRTSIRHPDATHEQFLKAGSARVVFPIRPGFETQFLELMETMSFAALPGGHPYVSIAEEMRNYAATNYPGIPSANPSKQGGAWRQIQTFRSAIEAYYRDCGRYPTTAEGLAALVTNPGAPGWAGPYLTEIPLDPWSNPYRFTSPGTHGDFDIVSFGADGRPGGSADNEDVVSWAEGTLIASWIEYTPTSALDIAVNDTLPSA